MARRNGLPIKISLPDGFLCSETRCGYEIPAKMKRIWAVELDLLSQFQRVCSKYDIKYVALWGTALGAVRHSGFIPWDDDIDVGMARDDYNRLCRVASKEFEYPYFFQTPQTDQRYFTPLARLRNSKTTAAIKGFDTLDYNNGIYIDIDVLDGLALTKLQWRGQNLIKHIGLVPIKLRMPFHSFWLDLYTRICCMYNDKSTRKGLSYSFRESEWQSWISSKGLIDTVVHDFEFMKIPLMGDWKEYLIRAFGEWQDLPSVERRGAWHKGQVYFDPDRPFVEVIAKGEVNYNE